MSREVAGLAPEDAVTLVTAAPRAPTAPALLVDSGSNRRGYGNPSSHSRQRTALLLVLVLACAAIGWWTAADWRAAQDQEARLGSLAASAVTLDLLSTGADQQRGEGDLLIRVTNLGAVRLVVAGAQRAFTAGEITQLSPARRAIEPGRSDTVTATVAVSCDSPLALTLPALQIEGPDRRHAEVQLEDDAAVLATICQGQATFARVLRLHSATVIGVRLRIVLSSPSDHVVTLHSITAGGVQLTGRPLPGVVHGTAGTGGTVGPTSTGGQTIWLDPPSICPPSWTTGGLPRTLTIDLDVGGPATVSLDVGYPLARWLLATSCSPATP